MTETTTGSNQRSHVASGQVPFVPSAVGSESTNTSLAPAAQQLNLKGSSNVMTNTEQNGTKSMWKGSEEYQKLGGDDQKMNVLLA